MQFQSSGMDSHCTVFGQKDSLVARKYFTNGRIKLYASFRNLRVARKYPTNGNGQIAF